MKHARTKRKKVISALLTAAMLMAFFVPGSPLSGAVIKSSADQAVMTFGDYRYAMVGTTTVQIVEYTGSSSSLVIPATLGGYTVVSVGVGAFSPIQSYGHDKNKLAQVKNVVLPEGLTTIDAEAFCRNPYIQTVTFPSTLTTIADYAFTGCTSLTSITIPKNTKKIHKNAFTDCSSLESIVVEKGNLNYDSRNDCNALIQTGNKTLLQGCRNTVIPADINSIQERAFANIPIKGVMTIPYGIKYVGDAAFIGNVGMTGIVVPSSVLRAAYKDFELDYTFGYDLDLSTANYDEHYGTFIDIGATRTMNPEFVVYGHSGTIAEDYVTWELGLQQVFVPIEFNDVWDPNLYYFEAVKWGKESGIVGGYSDETFRPEGLCTRAQMVAFLWRMAGTPSAQNRTNPFKDVTNTGAYYYEAMLWAYENGILGGVKGPGGTLNFNPEGVCTRAQAVTFMWRMAGCPEPKSSTSSFADVRTRSKYYYRAVLWASEQGITGGVKRSDGRYNFAPEGECARRQMVAFLQRYDKVLNG